MSSLLCLGLGYCARFYVAAFGPRFAQITGTARTLAPARGVTMFAFDTAAGPPSRPVHVAVAGATHLLISATPGPSGDPIHAALAADILAAPRLAGIVYLSSLGVYGDHDGAWVDEDAATVPMHARGGARLAAEAQWQALGRRRGVPVAVLRLAGIYGPGRNVFTRLLAGRAHRVAKPGHVFNRVHVDDVAQAIDAAFARRFDGIVNVTDDAPAPYSEQVLMAAQLLGVPPPPELSIAQARALMSPMAFSFYAGCVRARNDRLKSGLGVTLRYPTYREGLHALFAQGYAARDPLQLATNAAS
ncbi:MAG: NAD-dependent epimerase/dehydratase family protein [Hyphomicrobiales bacterium]|nr:NAD-dependent epimerase/dehydratase family protein [Hyphomicrobiales bacterium]